MLEDPCAEDEETRARRQVEALERMQTATDETRASGKDTNSMIVEDENYADLFEGDEEDDDSDGTETGSLIDMDEPKEDFDDAVMV